MAEDEAGTIRTLGAYRTEITHMVEHHRGRVAGLAEAGGVCISGTVHDLIENKLDSGFEDLGDQTVKNIPKPLR